MATYARFEHNGKRSYGTVIDGRVEELQGGLLEPPQFTGRRFALDEVKLLAPCEPPKVLAVGQNYISHLGERKTPKNPEMFYKPITSLQNPSGPIEIPADAEDVHYEGELVVIIGKTVRNASREEAAAAARRTADEKKAGGTGTISDELEAAAAQDAADLAATRAGAVRPAPIRAPLAQVNSRREIEFKLTDSRKALGWLLKNRRTAIEQAARTILGAHLRSIGVDALERDGADIPGIEVSIRREAAIGR